VDLTIRTERGGVESLSTNALAPLAHPAFDLCFIDADHSYEGVRADYIAMAPSCRVIMHHDIQDVTCLSIAGYSGGVPLFWQHLKEQLRAPRFSEFVDQSSDFLPRFGIGIVWSNGHGTAEVQAEIHSGSGGGGSRGEHGGERAEGSLSESRLVVGWPEWRPRRVASRGEAGWSRGAGASTALSTALSAALGTDLNTDFSTGLSTGLSTGPYSLLPQASHAPKEDHASKTISHKVKSVTAASELWLEVCGRHLLHITQQQRVLHSHGHSHGHSDGHSHGQGSPPSSSSLPPRLAHLCTLSSPTNLHDFVAAGARVAESALRQRILSRWYAQPYVPQEHPLQPDRRKKG